MANWYVSSVGYAAVPARVGNTTYAVGALRRQTSTPSPGNERVFRITTAGKTAQNEPTFNLNKGQTTNDGGAVWTEVTGQEAYAWSAPHARIANATASGWATNGDNVFVAHDHSYSVGASYNIGMPTSSYVPVYLYCVNSAGSVPPVVADLRTTGAEATTGGFTLTMSSGQAYFYGLSFTSGSGGVNNPLHVGVNNDAHMTFESCVLKKGGTGSNNASVQFGANGSGFRCKFVLNNTKILVGTGGDSINLQCSLVWRATPSPFGSVVAPTSFLFVNGGGAGDVLIEGLDLSALNGTALVGGASTARTFVFKDCQLASNVIVSGDLSPPGASTVLLLRSDSAATNYRNEKHMHAGSQTAETVIVRTGGASDGTIPLAICLKSNSNARWVAPLEALPISVWNATTGTPSTVTIEGIMAAADSGFHEIPPLNDEVWVSFEYLGAAANPLGTYVGGTKASALAAGTSQTASTAAWDSLVQLRANNTSYTAGNARRVASNPGRVFWCTTVGGGTSGASEPAGMATAVDGSIVYDGTVTWRAGYRFRQTFTFTAQMAGYVYAYVKVAKASATVYIDPKMTLA